MLICKKCEIPWPCTTTAHARVARNAARPDIIYAMAGTTACEIANTNKGRRYFKETDTEVDATLSAHFGGRPTAALTGNSIDGLAQDQAESEDRLTLLDQLPKGVLGTL